MRPHHHGCENSVFCVIKRRADVMTRLIGIPRPSNSTIIPICSADIINS